MIAKIVGLCLGSLVLLLVGSLLWTLFLMAGWNWGLVPAIGVNSIGLGTAWWLSVFISTVSACIKGIEVTTKD